jgi:hypothetical protein
MSTDKRLGLILIAASGAITLLSLLWLGKGWTALAVAALVVTIAFAAGWSGERWMKRQQ